jgi:branched-chain amino acid transport system substrate-binding protein
MERSRFLIAAGSAAAATTLLARPARAAEELVLCGMVSSPVGSQQDNERGWNLALTELKKTIAGHPVRFIERDDQGKPDVGVQQVTDAYEHDNARFFVGVGSSAIALAVMQAAKEKKAMFVTSTGADEITGKDCNTETFRWVVPAYDAVRSSLYPFLKRFPNVKKIYTLTPSYAFGESMLQNVKDVAAEKGLTLIGNDYHPLGATEFSNYLAKVADAKPDALIVLSLTADAIKTLKTVSSFGLKKTMKIVWPWSAGLSDFEGVGADDLEGVYVGTQFYHDASPVTRAASAHFHSLYGVPMNYFNATAYTAVRLIAMAAQKANSIDPIHVARALEGMQYTGLTGPESVRAFDNQAIKQYYLGVGKAKSQMRDQWDLVQILASDSNPIPRDRSLCKSIAP